jgi:hypothetical protein
VENRFSQPVGKVVLAHLSQSVLQNFVSFAFTLSFGGVPVEEELDARNVFRDCFLWEGAN